MSRHFVTEGGRIIECITELTAQVRRVADALDRIAPIPVELSPDDLAELDKINDADMYADQTSLDETLAMIEMIEARGDRVPDAAYRKFGLEPPNRKLATVDEEALAADQSELARPEPPCPAEPPNPNLPASAAPQSLDAGIVGTRKPGL